MNVTELANNRAELILSIRSNPPGDLKVRVFIEGGGCSGFKYEFDVTKREDDDVELSEYIVTDPLSLMYFEGATLDFEDNVFNQKFVINNPNVKSTCGCGESIGF